MTETQTKQPKKPKTRDTAPDFKSPAVVTKRAFWCGAMPSSPYSCITISPATFTLLTEEVIEADPGEPSERIPHIGSIVHLTADDLETIRQKLRTKVIRFEEPEDTHAIVRKAMGDDGRVTTKTEPIGGAGATVRVARYEKRARRGRLVHIPSDEEIRARKKNGLPSMPYVRGPLDEPLDQHIFMVPASDPTAEFPSGGKFPRPISETGIPNWEDAQPSE